MTGILYASRIQNEIIKEIIKNKDLMKLLYYDKVSALSEVDISDENIYDMLYGDIDKERRIFLTAFNPEQINEVKSEIRIYKRFVRDSNTQLMKVLFFFEIIVHQDIELLDNAFLRSDVILECLLDSIKPITAIGKLDLSNKDIMPMNFGKDYHGMIFCASTRIIID